MNIYQERRFSIYSIPPYDFNLKLSALFNQVYKNLHLQTIVLVQRKSTARDVCSAFNQAGINCVESHRNRTKAQRQHANESFQRGFARVLVLTDKSYTGNESFSNVHVVQFDNPNRVNLMESCLQRHLKLYEDRVRVRQITFFFTVGDKNLSLTPLLVEFLTILRQPVPEWLDEMAVKAKELIELNPDMGDEGCLTGRSSNSNPLSCSDGGEDEDETEVDQLSRRISKSCSVSKLSEFERGLKADFASLSNSSSYAEFSTKSRKSEPNEAKVAETAPPGFEALVKSSRPSATPDILSRNTQLNSSNQVGRGDGSFDGSNKVVPQLGLDFSQNRFELPLGYLKTDFEPSKVDRRQLDPPYNILPASLRYPTNPSEYRHMSKDLVYSESPSFRGQLGQ
jgi:hypothetical protein